MNLSLTPEQAEAWSLATRGPWPRVDGSASDPDWMALALKRRPEAWVYRVRILRLGV